MNQGHFHRGRDRGIVGALESCRGAQVLLFGVPSGRIVLEQLDQLGQSFVGGRSVAETNCFRT